MADVHMVTKLSIASHQLPCNTSIGVIDHHNPLLRHILVHKHHSLIVLCMGMHNGIISHDSLTSLVATHNGFT